MQKEHPTAVTANERAAAATSVVEASVWCTKMQTDGADRRFVIRYGRLVNAKPLNWSVR